ncbi:reverse transcriptase, partial [Phytophthora megakarya]
TRTGYSYFAPRHCHEAKTATVSSGWQYPTAYSETSFTIIMPVLREAIKASEGRTGGSKRTFTGVGCIAFTGYVIAKAGPSREAKTVAENFEECVFRRFGASEVIRHDREPGFMSDFFRAFNRIVKMRQSTTMAYRPQGNGKAERTVQTLTRALKMYVADVNQQLGRLCRAADICVEYGT